ncbi:ABC transporter substrate-binding protein [Treponema brennaborense]|uniref:Extracellular ligand-binding receptor n=1 Tax=Treponema brennaborense (strain DSM 12168 / CIP 105900 / DD5/3) TaxID=906968 RepID=F4LLN2_TREBD|nr:ABC transporter substrate-binding protein [Treponema brennaborense]AEE17676.1 Extracellular ligand-binding receptor [Treponema brennaborense DSM 12168]
MKNVAKTALIVLLVVLSFGMIFTGCAKESGNTIKIGGIFPLSGAVAVYGVECRNGIMLAIDEINAAGGVNGKMLELISEDDEGSPEKSVNVYKKLVTKDKCSVIIGSLTSGCTAAISSLAQAQKVLLLAPAATMESITDAGDYVFRACFIDPFQGTVGGKFSAETLQAKRAAVLYDIGNDYSIGLYENFKKTFELSGGTLVAAESYSTGDKDFNAQLTKIKNANPDVVYLPDYYGTVALIAKQLRAQGITAPIVGADGWDGIIDNAGDEVLNGFYSNHYAADSTDPRVIAFVSSYQKKYGSTPVSFAALGYDCVYLLKDAIVASGSTEPTVLKDALMQINNAYVTGNLTFDAKRNPIKSAVMMEIVKKDGKLTPVYNATVNP